MNEDTQSPLDEKSEEQSVTINVEVSQDKSEAFVTIIPLTDDPHCTQEEIKNALNDKGIKFGVDEKKLAELLNDIQFDERIQIASGTKPEDGKDGTITYKYPPKVKSKIGKGDIIGETISPKEGKNGIDVFQEAIQALPVKNVGVPELINAGFAPDDPSRILANIDGYLLIDQAVQVIPFFTLDEITDHYEAEVTVTKLMKSGDFTSEDLKEFLKSSNIVFGILNKEIESIFAKGKFEQKIVVAKGRTVKDEKDGKVKYYFDTELKPFKDEKGNVDYKKLNFIQVVNKGDKLAEIVPPVKGVVGCTILGETIQPKEGQIPLLPSGNNVHSDPGNPNVLISEIDGTVSLKGKNVEVDPVITIKENVDYSTGNINFDGSVIVNGDVKSGFNIQAHGDVQINGLVEDSHIVSHGNVLVKTGFIGKGDGTISAQGNVVTKYCDTQKIKCEGNLEIGDFVMQSNIHTKGKLTVTEQTGLIVGGEIYAMEGVEAKVLGNQNYTQTTIYAGVDNEYRDLMRMLGLKLAKNIEQKSEVEKALAMYKRRLLVKKTISESKKILIEKLKQLQIKLLDEESSIRSEIETQEKKPARSKIPKSKFWTLSIQE